jgi:hypothetical protein
MHIHDDVMKSLMGPGRAEVRQIVISPPFMTPMRVDLDGFRKANYDPGITLQHLDASRQEFWGTDIVVRSPLEICADRQFGDVVKVPSSTSIRSTSNVPNTLVSFRVRLANLVRPIG